MEIPLSKNRYGIFEIAEGDFPAVLGHFEHIGLTGWLAFMRLLEPVLVTGEYPVDYLLAVSGWPDTKRLAVMLDKRLRLDDAAAEDTLWFFNRLLDEGDRYHTIQMLVLNNGGAINFNPYELFPSTWGDIDYVGDFYLGLFLQLLSTMEHAVVLEKGDLPVQPMQQLFDDAEFVVEGMAFFGNLLKAE